MISCCAYILHPPRPRARRDVRFAQASTALYKWSFQASLLPSRNGTHVVPTAPVEGAPPAICKSELVPRARSGSRGTICVSFPSFRCARSASMGDQPAPHPTSLSGVRVWGRKGGQQPHRFRLDFVLRFHYKGPHSVAWACRNRKPAAPVMHSASITSSHKYPERFDFRSYGIQRDASY